MDDHESVYNLFEIGGRYHTWRSQVKGLMHAGLKLSELSAKSSNECYAVHQSTNDIVARLNVAGANLRAPLVFNIAYDPRIAEALTYELPPHGCRFGYAVGNDLACAILSSRMDCDVFILGDAAPHQTRRSMAGWLNSNYPDVPTIALKSPSEPDIAAAHFNLELNGYQVLLSTIMQALEPAAPTRLSVFLPSPTARFGCFVFHNARHRRRAANEIITRLQSSMDPTAAQVHQVGECLYINQRALMLCRGICLPRARWSGVGLPAGSVQLFPRSEAPRNAPSRKKELEAKRHI
jgi:hypothetical protein